VVKRTTLHDQTLAMIQKFPFPLQDREFVMRQVSCTLDGTFLYAIASVDDDVVVDYGMSGSPVRATSKGLIKFTPTETDPNQCSLELYQYFDAGGWIPAFVANRLIPLALEVAQESRMAFQRDDEVDEMERNELAGVIEHRQQVYDGVEVELMKLVHDKLGSIKEEDFNEFESSDHLVKVQGIIPEGSSVMVGRATTLVDASIAEVAAWELAKMSRVLMHRHTERNGLQRELKKMNEHHLIFHMGIQFPVPGLRPRQLVLRIVWKWAEGRNELMIYIDSVEHESFPDREGSERMPSTTMIKYKREDSESGVAQTKIVWTQQVDVGESIPRWIVNRQGLRHLSYVRAPAPAAAARAAARERRVLDPAAAAAAAAA
jgi:hypothetical protein